MIVKSFTWNSCRKCVMKRPKAVSAVSSVSHNSAANFIKVMQSKELSTFQGNNRLAQNNCFSCCTSPSRNHRSSFPCHPPFASFQYFLLLLCLKHKHKSSTFSCLNEISSILWPSNFITIRSNLDEHIGCMCQHPQAALASNLFKPHMVELHSIIKNTMNGLQLIWIARFTRLQHRDVFQNHKMLFD